MPKLPSLDTLRKRIAALQEERLELDQQKRSRSEVAAQIEAMVASWGYTGTGMLSREVQRAATGVPSEPLTLRTVAPVAAGVAQINLNAGPLLVAILGTEVVKAALLASLCTVPEGMPSAARVARMAEIGAELDRLEIEEERLCTETGAERRPDARPEIVLA